MIWDNEPFDDKAGPFFHRLDPEGRLIAAFKADRSHLNGISVVHGGCLVTLADYSMFTLSAQNADDDFVTISLNSEFVGPAREGDTVTAYPEIVRRGKRMLFARGLIMVQDRVVLSFTGTMTTLPKAPKSDTP
jgi:uncharacterized protein (TIGR00369 family)